MKKYIKPSLKTMMINNQVILAGSDENQIEGQAGGETDVVGAKGNAIWGNDND